MSPYLPIKGPLATTPDLGISGGSGEDTTILRGGRPRFGIPRFSLLPEVVSLSSQMELGGFDWGAPLMTS